MRVLLKATAVAGENATLIVQEAPTARVAVQLGAPAGNVPPVTLVKGCGVPPPKVNVPTLNPELPVFVTVRFMGLLVVPVAQFPNASGLGETVAVKVGVEPVPESDTGEFVTATLPVIATWPV